jgi:hypothetical protein
MKSVFVALVCLGVRIYLIGRLLLVLLVEILRYISRRSGSNGG